MKKAIIRIFAAVLIVALAGGTPAQAWSIATPWDTNELPCNEAVINLVVIGVVTGYDEDMGGGYMRSCFKPEGTLTRAEAAKLMSKALGLEDSSGTRFGDCEGHWAEKYIDACDRAGVIAGYEDGTFRPQEAITAEHFTALCLRAVGYTNEVLPDMEAYMAKAEELGLLDGIETPALEPITRGEAVMILYAASNLPLGSVRGGEFSYDEDGATLYGMMHARFDLYGSDGFYGFRDTGRIDGGTFVCGFSRVMSWNDGFLDLDYPEYAMVNPLGLTAAYIYSPQRDAFHYVLGAFFDDDDGYHAYSEEDVMENYAAAMVGPRTAGSVEAIFIVRAQDADMFFARYPQYVCADAE